MVLLDQAERLLAIGRLVHGEALMQLQLLGQRPAQRIVVIDDQHLLDGRHHESFATPAAARPSLPSGHAMSRSLRSSKLPMDLLAGPATQLRIVADRARPQPI